MAINMDLFERELRAPVDFDRDYTCPDCGAGCQGLDLINNSIQGKRIYVCPNCGCVQEVNEIERQLGEEN